MLRHIFREFLILSAVSLYWFAPLMDTAYALPLRKLDPVLRELVFSGKLTRLAPGQLASLHLARPHEPDMINTVVKVSGNPTSLESTGARVRSVTGSIVTADVPVDSLNSLMALPNVTYIQAARQMLPALLDISVPDTRADQVWTSTPGYTGKGVIVGVIDAGIDWTHPDFRGRDGTSRILYIWDQTSQGREPSMYGYGVEWTKEHIDSGQCQEMDATSHGTHIASTIAGNGGGRHEFTGVAPEANIIAVKTSFQDADIIDAAMYIFRRAEELNMPAVINMSFGSHWGAHDGTAALDQALDELLDRPGRIIVASAGNDGGSSIHVGTFALRQPVNGDYPWTAVLPSVGAQSVAVQIWYPVSESLSVRLLVPENEEGDLDDSGTGWVSTGQFRYFSVTNGPLTGAEIVIDADQLASESPNFNGVYIRISNDGDLTIPIDEYFYGIEYSGTGVEIDAYILWQGRFTASLPGTASSPSSAFLLEGDGSKTIISPSSASRVISVGSYTTRSEWIDSQNRIRTEEYMKVGSLSAFSSLGPLLNGARKPEITAPGEMVIAAFSADGWARPKSIYRDGEHLAWSGTSMSSPHVAGAAALIYEKYPRLSALEVRDMLTSTAVDMGQAGWDKGWGYGKLDALAALGIPSTPQGLRAAAGDGSVTATWSLNREKDIAGYNLNVGYRVPGAGFQQKVLKIQHPAYSYQITDLLNGEPVTLSVSAFDSDGNESNKSQEVIVTPDSPAPDVTAPDPPQDLGITGIDSAVDLTWSPSREHDLNGYRVYYGTSTGNYSKNAWIGKKTEYRLKNLTNGVRVYVAVSAVDTSGNESSKSREVSAIPVLLSRWEQRYQGGWPVQVQHDVYSSPALCDTDNDGKMEVAVSARDGKVYLLRHDGQYMAGWPVSTNSASISSPAVGDVDGDGSVEVVVGAGDMMYMWRKNGTPVNGWPVRMGGSVLASPALGDIDGDGLMEVVAGSLEGSVYAYNSDGSLVGGWPVATYGRILSSAALGDIDGDSLLEVVVGSENGDMYVFRGNGKLVDGWPLYIIPAVGSSPALGDIDGDGGMEIVTADERGRVHARRYDGKSLEGWPVDLRERISSSPALGDIDGDPATLETVIGTSYGSVYALRSNGTVLDGWPVSVMDIMTSSPALGDIDSDGRADIIIATGTGQGHVGLIYAFRNTGKSLSSTRWPLSVEGNIEYSSPALGDLDGDGDVELVVGSCRQADGTGGQVHAWDLSGRLGENSILWGSFRQNSLNTGVADDRLPPSFVITAIQNAALRKYLNIYVIASERLASPPELTLEAVLSTPEGGKLNQSLSLTRMDTGTRIYQADLTILSGGLYTFSVSGTDVNGNTGGSSKTIAIQLREQSPETPPRSPARFALLPNFPNPFNPGTWIPYELPRPADVTIDIYNVTGELIRSLKPGYCPAGSYTSTDTAAYWDGMDNLAQTAATGVYFCIFSAGDFRAIRKMILAK